MKINLLRLISNIALTISMVVTIWAILGAANWEMGFGVMVFIIWAVSPYLFVILVDFISSRYADMPKMHIVLCLLSLLMLGVTGLVYGAGLTGESSTESLIFIFLPLYLNIGSFIILALSFGVLYFTRRYSKTKI